MTEVEGKALCHEDIWGTGGILPPLLPSALEEFHHLNNSVTVNIFSPEMFSINFEPKRNWLRD
jgi:hypothetical protein